MAFNWETPIKFKGVTEDDLAEANEYVSVSRKALVALYEAVK